MCRYINGWRFKTHCGGVVYGKAVMFLRVARWLCTMNHIAWRHTKPFTVIVWSRLLKGVFVLVLIRNLQNYLYLFFFLRLCNHLFPVLVISIHSENTIGNHNQLKAPPIITVDNVKEQFFASRWGCWLRVFQLTHHKLLKSIWIQICSLEIKKNIDNWIRKY